MAQLSTLYKEKILKLNMHPKNYGSIKNPTYVIKEENIYCGDTITTYFLMENKKIAQASFEAEGCAILKASASIMTELIDQKDLNIVKNILLKYFEAIKRGSTDEVFQFFGSFKNYPSRIFCASLPWKCLEKILKLEGTA